MEMLEVYGKLCLWRDMFLMYRDRGIETCFEDVKKQDHPLYRCILCDGLQEGCEGYRPLDKELRLSIIRKRRQ